MLVFILDKLVTKYSEREVRRRNYEIFSHSPEFKLKHNDIIITKEKVVYRTLKDSSSPFNRRPQAQSQ